MIEVRMYIFNDVNEDSSEYLTHSFEADELKFFMDMVETNGFIFEDQFYELRKENIFKPRFYEKPGERIIFDINFIKIKESELNLNMKE